MITTTVLSLLLAALLGVNTSGGAPGPVQHGEGAPSAETNTSKPPNPVQHSE